MHAGYVHDLQRALSWRWTGDAHAMRSSCLMSEHQTSWWVRHWPLDWSRITGQLRPYLDLFRSLGPSVLRRTECCTFTVDAGGNLKIHVTFKSEDYSGSSNSFEASQKAGVDWRVIWFANESQTFLTWPDLQRCFSWRFCMGSSGGGAKYGVQNCDFRRSFTI